MKIHVSLLMQVITMCSEKTTLVSDGQDQDQGFLSVR